MTMGLFAMLSSILFVVFAIAEERERGFKKINPNNMPTDGEIFRSGISSVCKCSVSCVSTSDCVMFGFNTHHKECYLYQSVMEYGYNGTLLSNMIYYSRILDITTFNDVTTTSNILPTITTNIPTTPSMSLADRCASATYTFISAIDYCFQFYSTKVIWSTAQLNCQADGGRLTHMEPEAKLNYIKDTFLVPWLMEYDEGVYVGVFFEDASGNWVFTDSTGPVPDNHWVGSTTPTQIPGHCAYFDLSLYYHGLWHKPCTSTFAYICEVI